MSTLAERLCARYGIDSDYARSALKEARERVRATIERTLRDSGWGSDVRVNADSELLECDSYRVENVTEQTDAGVDALRTHVSAGVRVRVEPHSRRVDLGGFGPPHVYVPHGDFVARYVEDSATRPEAQRREALCYWARWRRRRALALLVDAAVFAGLGVLALQRA